MNEAELIARLEHLEAVYAEIERILHPEPENPCEHEPAGWARVTPCRHCGTLMEREQAHA